MSSAIAAESFGVTSQQPAVSDRMRGAAPRRWSRKVAADIIAIAECLAVVAGCLLPAFIYARAGGVPVKWLAIMQVGLMAAIIVHICLTGWRMYDTARMDSFPQRPSRLLLAMILACVALLGLGVPVPVSQPHILVWYTTWIMLTFTLMLFVRMVAQSVFARLSAAGRFDERVAVYGAGTVARRVRDHLVQARAGIQFVGAFDDHAIDTKRVNLEGLDLAGRLDDLVALARADGVDRIIVALPAIASSRIEMVARELEKLPVSLHVVTHIASNLINAGPAHKVRSLGPIGLMDVKAKPLADWAPIVKRAEDVLLGALCLLVTLPLFALIMLAIKLDSRGPVFFVQRRRGLNQQIIPVLKFLTMRVLEDGAQIQQATRDDPRVTRVGRLLRRSSLDELPQLINVLKGEMSLVGPRPHAIAHDEHYGEVLQSYAGRQQVKPGITGLAQVRGFRGETQTDDLMQGRVDNDLAYIKAWSPWLDLKILVRTVFAVVRGCNAH